MKLGKLIGIGKRRRAGLSVSLSRRSGELLPTGARVTVHGTGGKKIPGASFTWKLPGSR